MTALDAPAGVGVPVGVSPGVTADVITGPAATEPDVDGRPRRRFPARVVTAVVATLLVAAVYRQGETAGRGAAQQAATQVARTAAETAYLTVLRAAPVEDSLLPQGLTELSDAQLLSFGRQACAAYREGGTVDEVARAYGELTAPIRGKPGLIASPPNPMLPLVADTASRQLCPQYLAGSNPGPPAQRWDPTGSRDIPG